MQGIGLSIVFSVLFMPMYFVDRRPATRQWTLFQGLTRALILLSATVTFEFILLWIRGSASSAAYLGIDASIFSVAVISLVALVAIASFAWPQSKGSVA